MKHPFFFEYSSSGAQTLSHPGADLMSMSLPPTLPQQTTPTPQHQHPQPTTTLQQHTTTLLHQHRPSASVHQHPIPTPSPTSLSPQVLIMPVSSTRLKQQPTSTPPLYQQQTSTPLHQRQHPQPTPTPTLQQHTTTTPLHQHQHPTPNPQHQQTQPVLTMPVSSARLHPTTEQVDGATIQVLPGGGAVMVTLGAWVMQISPCGVRVTCSHNGHPKGVYSWANVPREEGNPIAQMFDIATQTKRTLLDFTPKVAICARVCVCVCGHVGGDGGGGGVCGRCAPDGWAT